MLGYIPYSSQKKVSKSFILLLCTFSSTINYHTKRADSGRNNQMRWRNFNTQIIHRIGNNIHLFVWSNLLFYPVMMKHALLT